MPQVRMLTDYTVGDVVIPANSVPTLSDALVAAMVSIGAADTDPAGIAYAAKLGVPIPDGLPVEEAAPAPTDLPPPKDDQSPKGKA